MCLINTLDVLNRLLIKQYMIDKKLLFSIVFAGILGGAIALLETGILFLQRMLFLLIPIPEYQNLLVNQQEIFLRALLKLLKKEQV